MSRARRAQTRKTIAAVLLSLLALIVVAVVWALFFMPAAHVAAGTNAQVRVPAGASTAQIATKLARAGIVQNALAFRLYARLARADATWKAGVYDLKTGAGYAAAVRVLQAGPKVRYTTVTIPEGFTAEQIAARLQKEAHVPATAFLKLAQHGAPKFASAHPYLKGAYDGSLEGYLFPKTYEIAAGSSASDVVGLMLDQFDAEIAKVDLASAKQAGFTVPQVVTIASMIEREAKIARDRPLVSSVIYNRLRRGMHLEIDATVQYVLLRQHFRLSYRQTEVKSPYNTYLHAGLPPGPISNPGLASLQAAAHPAQTSYLYYVLTGKDGSHTFATTRSDFLKAKALSKKVFGR